MARLDDTLEKSARDARAAEAQAMRDQLGLLKSGARAEDIRAMEAQVRAAAVQRGAAARECRSACASSTKARRRRPRRWTSSSQIWAARPRSARDWSRI